MVQQDGKGFVLVTTGSRTEEFRLFQNKFQIIIKTLEGLAKVFPESQDPEENLENDILYQLLVSGLGILLLTCHAQQSQLVQAAENIYLENIYRFIFSLRKYMHVRSVNFPNLH